MKQALFVSMMCFGFIILFFMVGCTISFQNISTHGTATDLVDENQGATADVKPNIQIPSPI